MIRYAPLYPLAARFLDASSSAYSRRIRNFPHSESMIIYIHYRRKHIHTYTPIQYTLSKQKSFWRQTERDVQQNRKMVAGEGIK